MRSDEKFDHTNAETKIPTGSTVGNLRRNPVISRYRQKLDRGKVDKDVLSSSAKEFLRLANGNEVGQNSRIMAWDNQRIFGPAPETRSSAANGD